ncbi:MULTISPECIES: response regulator [Bacillaceae]|uniref:response regulator n=1 Tax=Bacillaceae TaxID=186817 RepID=UPI000E75645F|nr:response regulator [Bacillus sp. PK3_68]RJS58742.1 DNA-binding response regulator [Bacillus sp. PK3_68]
MAKIKAVIAEDDFRVADIHEKFLNKFDQIEVVGKALNAEQTLELLDEQQPDLLLLDVYMPDQLGSDLLPVIREKHQQVDILMITAATDREILEKALHYGVEYFLIKPVKMERFNQIIEEYLKKSQLLRSTQEVDQEIVDMVFNKLSKHSAAINRETSLPKGVDEITLSKVTEVLAKSDKGLSAEQAADQIGASRTTARRYLEYLVSIQECRAEVVYGVVGRPERKYYKI